MTVVPITLALSSQNLPDGTTAGMLRAQIASGDLFLKPFRDGEYYSEVNAGGANYLKTGGTPAQANSDGSGTALYMLVQDAWTHNGGNAVWVPFYGTRFGVRHLYWPFLAYRGGFSVWIDGVVYEVRHHADAILGALTPAYLEMVWMCPDILKDHKHWAKIFIPGTMNTGYNNTAAIFTGTVVEHRPGNGEPVTTRRGIPVATGQLTNAFVTIPINNTTSAGSLQQPLNAKAIRRIDYYNTDTGPRVVQISANGSVIWETVLAAAGSAGSSDYWPKAGQDMNLNGGTDTTFDAYYAHKADASSKVNFHVLGVS